MRYLLLGIFLCLSVPAKADVILGGAGSLSVFGGAGSVFIVSTPSSVVSVNQFLLLEDGSFLLLEDGTKIIL